MQDHNIVAALKAVRSGRVRHVRPFDWICGDGAEHIDPRVLQRALQQGLIKVGDRGEEGLVTLTAGGEAKILAHREG
jgi:hypothetical protein